MSYILDALRRADSERERKRGAVPGLHAQPVLADAMDAEPGGRSRLWVWLLAGVCLGLVTLTVWQLVVRDEPEESQQLNARAPVSGLATASSESPMPGTVAAPASAAAPIAAAPAQMVAPPRTAPVAPNSLPERVAAMPEPATTKPLAAAASVRSQASGPQPAPNRAPQAATQATPPVAAASQPEAPVPKLTELAEDLRREVPAMAFGGAVYSTAPAQRMVIVNGQLLREGEAMSAELTLEEIRPKSAVFRIRSQRFEWLF
jgi:general secretion pathway protein B